jgi:hypothetical protein
VLAALLLAAALDLYAPRRVDIRRFEAAEVARLDTAMWRSYYERKPVALFFQLAELMRRQFHYPLLRSYIGAARAARAAFVFKDGHDRAEYQRALPDLIDYYQGIHAVSATPFDVSRTAQLELEWWIVHRERARHDNGALERALAEAAAELYRMPAAPMMEYARYRAAAMRIRDEEAAARSLDEQDWSRIERRLNASWRALARAVRPA